MIEAHVMRSIRHSPEPGGPRLTHAALPPHPGEAARRVGMEEFAGCPGSPGDTDATGTDWSDWAESVTWHEAVASAHIARRRAAGAKRVTSSPFSLGMRPM